MAITLLEINDLIQDFNSTTLYLFVSQLNQHLK